MMASEQTFKQIYIPTKATLFKLETVIEKNSKMLRCTAEKAPLSKMIF